MRGVVKITHFILTAVYLLTAQQTFAQKQGDVWLFGEHCGLSFVTDTPLFLGGCNTQSTPTLTQQGSSSICDNMGRLLFYTDGHTIWNSNDTVMYNGDSLLGDISSTQSSLIVPQPGCSNYYYVFTTGSCKSLTNGFRYSIVNICADNGYGEVLKDQKNVLLLDTVAEKLCAMMDSSGNYWILAHKLFSNAFCAYRLTPGGLGDSVVTRIGSVEGDSAVSISADEAVGQMKFSPDGRRVALVVGNRLPSVIELYDFNPSTGKLSNAISIPLTYTSGSGYGVEFSPNSSILYASAGDTMIQLNLQSGGGLKDSVIASVKLISRAIPIQNSTWGLQLGPDNKVYVCQNDTTLGVINNPNLAGALCDYQADKISLDGHMDKLTLPDYVAGYRYGNITPNCNLLSVGHRVTNACADELGSVVEQASGGTLPITITWNTDPPQYGSNADNLSPGTYVAVVTGGDPCEGPVTIHDSVTIQKGSAILVMPNAFTPGSHDINAVFLPHIECNDNLNYLLRIYNRWGQLLFETNNPAQGWDGKFNGKPEEVGVYDYYVEFNCGSCHETKKGNITLLR